MKTRESVPSEVRPSGDKFDTSAAQFQVGDELYPLRVPEQNASTTGPKLYGLYGFVYNKRGGVDQTLLSPRPLSLHRSPIGSLDTPETTSDAKVRVMAKKGGSTPTSTPDGHKKPEVTQVVIQHKHRGVKITEVREVDTYKCTRCGKGISQATGLCETCSKRK